MFKTTILKYIESPLLEEINTEIANNLNNEHWDVHHSSDYKNWGPGRHGQTFWLNFVKNDLTFQYEYQSYFPNTMNIIKLFAQSDNLGRTYWHRLSKGKMIEKHADIGAYFSKLRNRYQIYLDTPDDFELMVDGEFQSPVPYKNCFVDFNLSLPHYYKNNNDKDFYILVIDILKPEYKIIY
jgi:hypothetical protein